MKHDFRQPAKTDRIVRIEHSIPRNPDFSVDEHSRAPLRLIHTDCRIRKMPRSHDDELNRPVLVSPKLSPLNFNVLRTKNVEKIRQLQGPALVCLTIFATP